MGDATKNCPACGEAIKPEAVICRHCRTDLRTGQPAGGPPPPPVKSGGGISVVLIVAVVVLVLFCGTGVLAALLLPAIARATRNAKVTSCVNNQSQLWKMQINYMVQFGGREKRMPEETGGSFWLKLSQTDPPLIDVTLREIYECPLKGSPNSPGTTDYRGPNGNVNRFNDGDPVGADKIGNHGSGEGGNVLRKSGDVQTVSESDPLWSTAAVKTVP